MPRRGQMTSGTCNFLLRNRSPRESATNVPWSKSYLGFASALARHLQPNGDEAALRNLDPGRAPVTVDAAHKTLQAHERPKENDKLAVLYATLREGYDMGGPGQAADERGLRERERAHGGKVLGSNAGCRLGEHVTGPNGLGAHDPRARLPAKRKPRELEGVRGKTGVHGALARAARTVARPQDEQRRGIIGC